MEFKGTKGKWFACCNETTPHFLFTEGGEISICSFIQKQEIGNDLSDDEFRANALLISKAPEMLEMLKILREECRCNYLSSDRWSEITKLIKEATEL